MRRVVVVGAGVSGLALAYRLRQRHPGLDITLLEREARPGGTVWTEERDGFRFEHGPNGFLDAKPSTLDLCRDLGLADRLVAGSDVAQRNRYLLLGDRLRMLPNSPGSFLCSDLLSWRGKLSLFAERFRRNRPVGDDESVDAFARRRTGREVAEVFADALVTGIHAGDPKLLSIRAAFPRVAALEAEHGSVLKGFAAAARERRRVARERGEEPRRPGKLWSFREGLKLLIDGLTAALPRPPLLSVAARRLERDGDGWVVRGDGAERWPADAVVLACPAHQQAALLAELDPELADLVGGIPYAAVAVVAVGYRREEVPHALEGFGYIAPQRTRRDLLGVQWCSSVYPGRAPDGSVLLRALCGGWHRPEVVHWDDARLLGAVRDDLRLALGVTAAPRFHRIVRWERAIPQYHVGHLRRVAAIGERARRWPRLHLAGNAYHGVALNDCTEQAGLLAERIGEELA